MSASKEATLLIRCNIMVQVGFAGLHRWSPFSSRKEKIQLWGAFHFHKSGEGEKRRRDEKVVSCSVDFDLSSVYSESPHVFFTRSSKVHTIADLFLEAYIASWMVYSPPPPLLLPTWPYRQFGNSNWGANIEDYRPLGWDILCEISYCSFQCGCISVETWQVEDPILSFP